jgi:hypothetical protein
VLYFALADDRLLNSADGGSTRHGRNFDNHFHADFVIGMHTWSDVYVDTNFEILKLRVHQRVDARSANSDSRLEAAGGHWHLVAYAKLGGLPVDGANFGVLNNLGVRVG